MIHLGGHKKISNSSGILVHGASGIPRPATYMVLALTHTSQSEDVTLIFHKLIVTVTKSSLLVLLGHRLLFFSYTKCV